MPRHRWVEFVLCLGMVCLAALLAPSRAGAVTVIVNPPDTTVTVGDTFLLRLQTDAFPDLKAYEPIHKYAIGLQYLGPLAGDVLFGDGGPYTIESVPDAVPPADTAWTDCAKLLTSTHGPGVLLYLRFKALVIGVQPIDCLLVDFRDSFNNPTFPACVGGVVRVEGPVPARRTSWGRVKSIYR